MSVETGDLLSDSAERLFGAHCGRKLREAADQGIWPQALWEAVEAAGLPLAMLPEEAGGAGVVAAMRVLRVAAWYGAPIPLAETMLAASMFHQAGMDVPSGPLSIAPVRREDRLVLCRDGAAWRLSGTAHRVPWGARCTMAVAAETDGAAMLASVSPASVLPASVSPGCGTAASVAAVRHGLNIAREPRDDVVIEARLIAVPSTVSVEWVRAAGAALRTVQIAGALWRCLDLSVRHAQTRVQFGRPIGKFQAVQQGLAVMACQAAAAQAAADMATEALEQGCDRLIIGAAKARAGEAASIAAALAHQTHGAIGFTREYDLHYATRRLWSWREEFGNEAEWCDLVGHLASGAGIERLWETVTTT